jgi:plastocyanin domain-containing protein
MNKEMLTMDDITNLLDEVKNDVDSIIKEEKRKEIKYKILNFKNQVVNKIKNVDLRIIGTAAGTIGGIAFHTWLKNRSKTKFTVSVEEIRNRDFIISADDGEEAVNMIMNKYLKSKITLSKKDIGSKLISITSPDGEITSWVEF